MTTNTHRLFFGYGSADKNSRAEDTSFVPEKVKLEESDLELKHDDELDRDWYQYHGFIVLPNV